MHAEIPKTQLFWHVNAIFLATQKTSITPIFEEEWKISNDFCR